MTVKQTRESTQATLDRNRAVEETAHFKADGTRFTGRDQAFAPVTVAGAIATAAKTTTVAEPAANTFVPIVFTSGNSANSPTVAFAGGSARAIQLGGTASTGAKCAIAAGGVGIFWFDGTILHQMGAYT